MKVTAYKWGVRHDITEEVVTHGAAGAASVIEVQLADGRTVQLVVESDGSVRVRGWGNKPALVGNMENTSFTATIPTQEPDRE